MTKQKSGVSTILAGAGKAGMLAHAAKQLATKTVTVKTVKEELTKAEKRFKKLKSTSRRFGKAMKNQVNHGRTKSFLDNILGRNIKPLPIDKSSPIPNKMSVVKVDKKGSFVYNGYRNYLDHDHAKNLNQRQKRKQWASNPHSRPKR